MRRLSYLRDAILLLLGTAGVIHQEFVREASDPGLLMFYAAIFGLAAFLPNGIADSLRNGGEQPPEVEEAPPRRPARRRARRTPPQEPVDEQ